MATAAPVQPRKPQSAGFLGTMARHPELACFIFALVFTALSKYTRSTSRPMVSHQPLPHRFFHASSPVRDFPYGNIYDVGDMLIDEEFLVVMYYAPWCGKSMEVREEFEKAARYMAGEVLFVGINCWYPSGSCRQQNNFVSYPVVYVYQSQMDGYKYSGVATAEYLLRFVHQIMYPLTYIHNHAGLANFIASKDNVVVGYFDFHSSPQPPGFQQFFYAARRIIEKDSNDVVPCGIITNPELASSFNMNRQKIVFLLRTLNETMKYPVTANFTSSALSMWVQSNRRQPLAKWLLPSGTKSLQFSKEINKGAALIMFTPDYPLTKVNQYFYMLREVALDYNNCNKTSNVEQAISLSISLRVDSLRNGMDMLNKCRSSGGAHASELSANPNQPITVVKRCCASIMPVQNNSCDLCMHYFPGHPLSSQRCPLLSLATIMAHIWPCPIHTQCMEIMPNYNANEHLSLCCSGSHLNPKSKSFSTTENFTHTDPYIHDVTSHRQARECGQWRLQRLLGWQPSFKFEDYSEYSQPEPRTSFTGIACQTNRTVKFYLMNSKLSYMFADNLGLAINPAANLPTLVLIDKKNEVHYLHMQEEVSKRNLESFIKNYTDDMLNRYLRNTQPVAQRCGNSQTEACVREVTTLTFKDIIMEEDKDVVLLHYAPWCGFCAGLAHIYLSLARYFRSAKNIIFARVNSDRNDLPWEFMVDSYPAVQFFPAYRKGESVSFPDHLSKTLPNLIQFVLHYATHSLRLETGLSICSRTCIRNNLQSVTGRIHNLHSEIRQKTSYLSHLNNYIQQFRTPSSNEEPSPIENSHGDTDVHVLNTKVKWLAEIQQMLKSQLRHKELQLQNSRQLHSALLSTQGFFIEQHKLTAIIKRYQKYRSLLSMSEQAQEEEEEVEDGDECEEITQPEAVAEGDQDTTESQDEL